MVGLSARRCRGLPRWPLRGAVLLLLQILLAAGAQAAEASPPCACGTAPRADDGLLCAEDLDIGCVLAAERTFPSWAILTSGSPLLPERTTLLMALAGGAHVVLASPDPHAALAAARGDPSSLSLLHHSPSALAALHATLSANGLPAAAGAAHGIPSAASVGELSFVPQPVPTSLEGFYSGSVASQGKPVAVPLVAWPRARGGSNLFVVGQGPGHAHAVEAAAGACSGACSLVVSLDYDAEGAVLGGGGLRALGALRALEEAGGHSCFWHMSDWAGWGGGGGWGDRLGPVLDVVCLHAGDARSPPRDTKVSWEADVNRQLAVMMQAFAPAFAQRHMFKGGVIKPAVCLGPARLCEGPSAVLRQFTPSHASRRGAPMPPEEEDASRRAAALIRAWQEPAEGCAGALLLAYCYVNPELAGHGAQVHSMAHALGYALAAGRRLAVNDSCPWDLHPTALGKGFHETYLQPVSSCPLPSDAAQSSGAAQGAGGAGVGEHVMVWDSQVDRSALRVPEGAEDWCASGTWDRACVPPEFRRFGPAWWHAHLVAHILRPSAVLEGLIAEARATVPVDRMVLGMHVRRGHKYIEIPPAPGAALFPPTSAFLAAALGCPSPSTPAEAARRFARRHGGKEWATALVASEDGAAVREVQELMQGMGARVSVVDPDHPRPNLRVSILMGLRLGILDAHRENVVSLVSLFLLSLHADVFVGSFSSGYSRLVMELALVHRKRRLPHHSLDIPFPL